MYVHYFIFSFHTISTFSMSMLHWITIDTFKPSVWCLKVFMGKKFFPLATDPKNLRILHETTMLFCPAKIASWLCLTLWYSLMNLDLFKACICLKLLCYNVSFLILLIYFHKQYKERRSCRESVSVIEVVEYCEWWKEKLPDTRFCSEDDVLKMQKLKVGNECTVKDGWYTFGFIKLCLQDLWYCPPHGPGTFYLTSAGSEIFCRSVDGGISQDLLELQEWSPYLSIVVPVTHLV